jgi:hypothetical protein
MADKEYIASNKHFKCPGIEIDVAYFIDKGLGATLDDLVFLTSKMEEAFAAFRELCCHFKKAS